MARTAWQLPFMPSAPDSSASGVLNFRANLAVSVVALNGFVTSVGTFGRDNVSDRQPAWTELANRRVFVGGDDAPHCLVFVGAGTDAYRSTQRRAASVRKQRNRSAIPVRCGDGFGPGGDIRRRFRILQQRCRADEQV